MSGDTSPSLRHSISAKTLVSKCPKMVDHIPCLYLPNETASDKMLLYFHGNAEDIGLAFDLLFLIG